MFAVFTIVKISENLKIDINLTLEKVINSVRQAEIIKNQQQFLSYNSTSFKVIYRAAVPQKKKCKNNAQLRNSKVSDSPNSEIKANAYF